MTDLDKEQCEIILTDDCVLALARFLLPQIKQDYFNSDEGKETFVQSDLEDENSSSRFVA